jgi:outer membrane protein OmpA-like peptidoglycan-associated protein
MSKAGMARPIWFARLLLLLVALQDVGPAEARLDAQKLRQNQSARDTLFKNLQSAIAQYTFEYVVIWLPSGSLPGIDVPVPVSHLRFSSTVFFAFDQFSLEAGAEIAVLDLARTVLKDRSLRSILVVGHTDSIGDDQYNAGLSLKRAATVATRLREAGVKDELLGLVPMGEAQPADTNSTPGGRALNRRVEFFISEIPEAARKVIEQRPVNPCHRNDHQATPGQNSTDCGSVDIKIPVIPGSSGTGRPKFVIDLSRSPLPSPTSPTVREPLPNEISPRPSIKELELQ